jgi:U3 small nucleolar RNA-associated protein 12
MQTVQAHTATVWSLHIRVDEKVLVSGSADKDVKFWEFEYTDVAEEAVSPHTSFQSGNLYIRCSPITENTSL